MTKNPESILRQVFGYKKFRPLQAEIIKNVLEKKDTLVIMPTGGGKSVCYQIPSLIFNGLTVVVSPLISLMKDQVEQLLELGIPATLLNSTLSRIEYNKNIKHIKQGKIKLMYVAPETLLKDSIIDMLSSITVHCLAIDEAHCISEWGHDFRPEYRELSHIKGRFSKSVCIALTATATPRVQKDIKHSLNIKTANEYISSFNRKNLFFRVIPKNNPFNQTVSFIKQFPNQSGIIYCFSRKQVDNLYNQLKNEGFSVGAYHAGLADIERKKNQERFIRDDVLIIVATIAFGMGINKPNVRFIIHYDLPKNIESYYQEIGRSGRDGLRSDCILLFSYSDIQKIRYFINQKNTHERRLGNMNLQALLKFAETNICRRIPLLSYFGEKYPNKPCGMCDNCISDKKNPIDITIYAQKFLSCVKRTGELFGTSHIIDVLRGSASKKVLKFNHQQLSTYGIGKDLSKNQWFYLSHQLIREELMVQDAKYGGLRLTPKAWNVFKGKETVLGRIEDEKNKTVKKNTVKVFKNFDDKLFKKLREKRKELADGSKIPPYVIFPDRTLMEISVFFPQTMQSLTKIFGVGEEKLKKYGPVFLDIICDYCEKNHIKENLIKNTVKRQKAASQPKKQRYKSIGELYNSGTSIEKIMELYNIRLVTVLDHLFKYILKGNEIRPEGLLPALSISKKEHNKVFRTFDKLGPEFLAPIFKSLNQAVSYDDIKILRLIYLSKKPTD